MSIVLREHKGWKAVQRASRADCELVHNDMVMAHGGKKHILDLFEKFSDLENASINKGFR